MVRPVCCDSAYVLWTESDVVWYEYQLQQNADMT